MKSVTFFGIVAIIVAGLSLAVVHHLTTAQKYEKQSEIARTLLIDLHALSLPSISYGYDLPTHHWQVRLATDVNRLSATAEDVIGGYRSLDGKGQKIDVVRDKDGDVLCQVW